mmetsp:Transcript_20287/g.63673  ORF Transcript_20287/g.63673 Transcript_20287/m.63673 type:complete len:212 (-) Transcript_20287:126-761(-)
MSQSRGFPSKIWPSQMPPPVLPTATAPRLPRAGCRGTPAAQSHRPRLRYARPTPRAVAALPPPPHPPRRLWTRADSPRLATHHPPQRRRAAQAALGSYRRVQGCSGWPPWPAGARCSPPPPSGWDQKWRVASCQHRCARRGVGRQSVPSRRRVSSHRQVGSGQRVLSARRLSVVWARRAVGRTGGPAKGVRARMKNPERASLRRVRARATA